jgi:hypothetical protein
MADVLKPPARTCPACHGLGLGTAVHFVFAPLLPPETEGEARTEGVRRREPSERTTYVFCAAQG